MTYGSSVYGATRYGDARDDTDTTRYSFIPPVRHAVPTTVSRPHPGNALFRYYQPRPEGINVYLLLDGTITEDWPYADAGVDTIFHGGHIHQVNTATAQLLANAGYTVSGFDPQGRYGNSLYGRSYYGSSS